MRSPPCCEAVVNVNRGWVGRRGAIGSMVPWRFRPVPVVRTGRKPTPPPVSPTPYPAAVDFQIGTAVPLTEIPPSPPGIETVNRLGRPSSMPWSIVTVAGTETAPSSRR